MPLSMPCLPRNRPAMAAHANRRACTMCAATWYGAKIECFGACRICAAAGCGAQSDPEPSACRFPGRPITKRASEEILNAWKSSRACAHAVLGECHGARIVPANGFQNGSARLVHGGRDMAQQKRMHAHFLRQLTDGARRGMQRGEDGKRSRPDEQRGI